MNETDEFHRLRVEYADAVAKRTKNLWDREASEAPAQQALSLFIERLIDRTEAAERVCRLYAVWHEADKADVIADAAVHLHVAYKDWKVQP